MARQATNGDMFDGASGCGNRSDLIADVVVGNYCVAAVVGNGVDCKRNGAGGAVGAGAADVGVVGLVEVVGCCCCCC